MARITHGLHEKPGRRALEFAELRGLAGARHRLVALVVRDVAERGQQSLRVFQSYRVRVFLIAVPSGARLALRKIPGDRERRVSQESWLSVGSKGVPRFPELSIALDGEALQSAQRLAATLRGDGLLDQIAAISLSEHRPLQAHRQQQRHNRKNVFHGAS